MATIEIDGSVYKSIEEYYNDPGLDWSIKSLYLRSGQRKPQNKDEEKVLAEIKEMEARGIAVDDTYGTY